MTDYIKDILRLEPNKIVIIILAYVIFVFMGEIQDDREEFRNLQKESLKMNSSMIQHLDTINKNISANTKAIQGLSNRVQTVESALVYKDDKFRDREYLINP